MNKTDAAIQAGLLGILDKLQREDKEAARQRKARLLQMLAIAEATGATNRAAEIRRKLEAMG